MAHVSHVARDSARLGQARVWILAAAAVLALVTAIAWSPWLAPRFAEVREASRLQAKTQENWKGNSASFPSAP